MIEYQVRDGSTRPFKMEEIKKAPNDLLELLIDQLTRNVEEKAMSRHALEN